MNKTELVTSIGVTLLLGLFMGLCVASAIDPCIWGENEQRLVIGRCYAVRGLGPLQEVSCDESDAARAVGHSFWWRDRR